MRVIRHDSVPWTVGAVQAELDKGAASPRLAVALKVSSGVTEIKERDKGTQIGLYVKPWLWQVSSYRRFFSMARWTSSRPSRGRVISHDQHPCWVGLEGTLPTSDNLVVRNLGVDTREGKLSVSDVSIGEGQFASTVVHMHNVSVIADRAARRAWDQSTAGVGCSRKVG